jgi:hypothetical protein
VSLRGSGLALIIAATVEKMGAAKDKLYALLVLTLGLTGS